ncbi:MAG: hypothetical protein KatS3mg103_0171 [Phycisphaerales bacterium]|nr:MAG: hypothetical protein KatS3mg103_0171 [Phycisphaerales bacterium]
MKRGILSATILALAACSVLAQDEAIVREGSGDHRAAMDAMELTAFDRSLLDGLTDWIGQPVTAQDIDGKPVLILTWASWHPGSTASARAAQLMSRTFADKGLVVLGVHADEGYDSAQPTAERLRLDFPIARDAGSKFRKALQADMDPNFYVVDRAGQIRFADVVRNSIRDAVKIVVDETPEQAAAAAQRRAGDKSQPQRIIQNVAQADLASIPEWGIPPQDPILYEDAKWPTRWREYEEWVGAEFGRRGDGDGLPIVDFNTELVTWLTPKPELNGRVRVVYFWAHNIADSYARVQPFMDQLQRRYGRDVAVIGAAVPIVTVEGYDQSELERQIEEFGRTLVESTERSSYRHAIAFDREWELLAASLGKQNYGDQMGRELARNFRWPVAIIYSSDNTVRWVGNPLDDRFKVALNRVIEQDPAVKLRRLRDEAYLARIRGR